MQQVASSSFIWPALVTRQPVRRRIAKFYSSMKNTRVERKSHSVETFWQASKRKFLKRVIFVSSSGWNRNTMMAAAAAVAAWTDAVKRERERERGEQEKAKKCFVWGVWFCCQTRPNLFEWKIKLSSLTRSTHQCHFVAVDVEEVLLVTRNRLESWVGSFIVSLFVRFWVLWFFSPKNLGTVLLLLLLLAQRRSDGL